MFIALLLAIVSLTGCRQKKFLRSFYVQDLDLTIDIERRDSIGLDDYRIYIYRVKEQKGQDYVDVKYDAMTFAVSYSAFLLTIQTI